MLLLQYVLYLHLTIKTNKKVFDYLVILKFRHYHIKIYFL